MLVRNSVSFGLLIFGCARGGGGGRGGFNGVITSPLMSAYKGLKQLEKNEARKIEQDRCVVDNAHVLLSCQQPSQPTNQHTLLKDVLDQCIPPPENRVASAVVFIARLAFALLHSDAQPRPAMKQVASELIIRWGPFGLRDYAELKVGFPE
ncbi:hypothetical protein SADUNF_Sadunf15G0105300 [Salix dunnii]|uniref:Uncharacterized protein n=1 Tax=Salix dunnii TaxID=1413687 RepID=A0A835JGC2_9ROSI|nr:hypothetical protein SADUNF_Sadunf15G0105300 [Salix dunnii]